MPPPITLTSPLPASDLWFDGMTLTQGLSELEQMQLQLLSPRPDLSPEDLLGQPVTVTVALRDDGRRHFHGLVSRFVAGDVQGRHYSYAATVRPWLWFLTRTSDCRIFQDQSVPDIVKAVFQDHEAIAKAEFHLFRSYRQRTYCVQYRESDYHFVARLLEEEGIYWYFRHDDGEHTLVLVDDAGAHEPDPACERLPYYANGEQVPPDTDYCANWSFSRQVKPGKVALTSYDFERPATRLDVKKVLARSHPLSDYEQFDWQGEWVKQADGTHLVDNRLDEWQAAYEQVSGGTNAQALAVGALFDLERHPREDRNGRYLCTRTHLSATVEGSESDDHAGRWQCSFQAIPAAQQYRPRRVTPKPFVQGPQTAVVTGPSGEELFTDRHGRVKVQFHWDRRGQRDEKSSCWIRVSQPWAGKGWGGVSIPRIGQEVVVDFLEGDPDQPLITGRVYNAEQTPPFELPAGAVVSGIKSKSHKAVGYNELSMDDTAGKEKVTIHGQYDMATTVEHDQTTTVHNNRTDTVDVDDTESVGNDQTQTVGNNQSQTVGADQKIKVGNNQTITIGVNRTETVGGAESITITGHRHEQVDGGEDVTINGARSHTVNGVQTTTISLAEAHTVGAGRAHTVGGGEAVTVGAAQVVTIAGAQMVSVGAVQKVNVGGLQSTSVGGVQSVSVKGPHKLSAAAISQTSKGVFKLKAAGTAMIEAPTIVLKAGGSQLILESGGVTIKGAKVLVKASGNVTINGGGGIKLKGPNIGEN